MALHPFRESILRLALRNLTRNKRRNLATASAVVLGFAALIVAGGFYQAMESFFATYTVYITRVGHLTIYQKGGFDRYATAPQRFGLSQDAQATLTRVLAGNAAVSFSGGQFIATGLIGNGCRTLPFIATGLDPQLDKALVSSPQMARLPDYIKRFARGRGLENFAPGEGAVILASGLALRLGKPLVHDELAGSLLVSMIPQCKGPDSRAEIARDSNVQLVAKTFTGRTAIIDGEVVAHFQGGSKDIQRAGIVMPLLAMQALYETDTVTIWSVWLKDATNLHAVQRQLAKSLEDEGLTVDILPWTDGRVNPLYTGTINFFTAILVFLTLVLIGIVVLSIFNAASMTVIERAPEIGMMRSLGFTRGAISKIFAAESLILSVIAMLIGSTLALAGIATVNHANIHLTPPGIAGGTFLKVEPGWSVVLGVVALITATTLSTALVAVKSVVRARIPSLLDGSRR